jgi:hypothetical protein
LSFADLGQETGFLAKHLHQCQNYHSPQPANELLLEVSTESLVVELWSRVADLLINYMSGLMFQEKFSLCALLYLQN